MYRMDGTRPPSKQTKLLFIQSINWCNSPEIAEIGISNWKAVSHLVIVSHVTTWHVRGAWHVPRSSCANCENVLVLSAEYNGSIVTDSGVQMCANTHPICVWHHMAKYRLSISISMFCYIPKLKWSDLYPCFKLDTKNFILVFEIDV